jgi:hypothetical protein
MGGLAMICLGVFAAFQRQWNRLWGALILLYTNIGFLAFGIFDYIYRSRLPLIFIGFLFGLTSASLLLSESILENDEKFSRNDKNHT